MNSKIEGLLMERENAAVYAASLRDKLNASLQIEFNKVFENDKALQKALVDQESATEYSTDKYGDIVRWFRYSGLSDFTDDTRPFLEKYVSDSHWLRIDWENECFEAGEGGDNIIINDGYGRDAGNIYQSGKRIIRREDYRNEDGDLDIDKRNALIGAHMERTGCFPGVFSAGERGDISPVNTQAKKK